MTVCLNTHGNGFILIGRLRDVNVREVSRILATPVFGSSVVFDSSNSVLIK